MDTHETVPFTYKYVPTNVGMMAGFELKITCTSFSLSWYEDEWSFGPRERPERTLRA